MDLQVTKYFVETGISMTMSPVAIKVGFFPILYSRSRAPNTLYYTDLWDLIKDIDEPITFCLNSHWPEKESIDTILDIIQKHPVKHHQIIITHVRRIMDGKHIPVTMTSLYTKFSELFGCYITNNESTEAGLGDILCVRSA